MYRASRVCPFVLIHFGVSDKWSGSISHAIMKPKVLESHNHSCNLAHTVLYVTQLPQSHDSCHQFASVMCDFLTCWTRSLWAFPLRVKFVSSIVLRVCICGTVLYNSSQHILIQLAFSRLKLTWFYMSIQLVPRKKKNIFRRRYKISQLMLYREITPIWDPHKTYTCTVWEECRIF